MAVCLPIHIVNRMKFIHVSRVILCMKTTFFMVNFKLSKIENSDRFESQGQSYLLKFKVIHKY